MTKRFSISSLIVILIGLVVISAILYFGASTLELFFGIIILGLGIYIIGIILGIIAFARKERGILKYVTVISAVILIFLFNIFFN